jgi:hypothetical protein
VFWYSFLVFLSGITSAHLLVPLWFPRDPLVMMGSIKFIGGTSPVGRRRTLTHVSSNQGQYVPRSVYYGRMEMHILP